MELLLALAQSQIPKEAAAANAYKKGSTFLAFLWEPAAAWITHSPDTVSF